jgi:hypothetical protein
LANNFGKKIAPVVALELQVKARMVSNDLATEDKGNLGARNVQAIGVVVMLDS